MSPPGRGGGSGGRGRVYGASRTGARWWRRRGVRSCDRRGRQQCDPSVGVERRAQRDRVLGMGIDHDRAAEPGRHLPGDQRDARRPPDQQHRVQVVGTQAGRRHHAGQGLDRRTEQRSDQLLQLGALQEHLALLAADPDRDGDRRLPRQRLLGVHAGPAELGDRGRRRLAVGAVVEGRPVGPQSAQDVAEHRLVDVDAAQALDALGPAQRLEPPVRPPPQDGGVEGATAEVVDRDGLPGGEAFRLRVPGRRGHGLGQQPGRRDLHQPQRLAQDVTLELSPVRRMGHGDGRRRTSLGLPDGGDDPPEHLGEAPVDGDRRTPQQQWGRVSHPALEPAGHAIGLVRSAPFRRVAHEEPAVRRQQHDRRHRRRPVPERRHLGPAVAGRGRGGVGGPEVDSQHVGHVSSATSRESPQDPRP